MLNMLRHVIELEIELNNCYEEQCHGKVIRL